MPRQLNITTWRGFFVRFLTFSAQNKSHPQSHRDVMTPHHIILYPLVKEKNEHDYVRIYSYEENGRVN